MILLAGCMSPAIDEAGYLGKVHHTAQELYGIVGTARLTGRLDLGHKLISPMTDTIISNAENDAQSAVGQLDSVQPPDPAMVKLRSSVDNVLQTVSSDISDLRIATRRNQDAVTRKVLSSLTQDLTKLNKLQSVQ